jgi:cytoskeletal protein RodZ
MPPVNNTVDNIAPEKHHINSWLIATIILILVTAGLIALSVWLYYIYNDQKTNVDTIKADAVSVAVKNQVDKDNSKFTEQEKLPNRQFVGPDDLGRVTFDYPKTWSEYVAQDASDGGTFEAYLNPITVPPISSTQQYALRVTIEQKDYDVAIASYNSLVKNGNLSASSVTSDGNSGTRFDGIFSNDIHGSAVIFKIRDKTLTIRTDATTFTPDFNKLVATIKFNQ